MKDKLFLNTCAIVVNRVFSKYRPIHDNRYFVKILQSEKGGKYYNFQIDIDGKVFEANYTFDSNVFLQGTLSIVDGSETKRYVIERVNDSLRIYHDIFSYDELFFFGDSKLVDITIAKNRKEYVSCVDIVQHNDGMIVVDNTVVSTSTNYNYNRQIIRDLFLISGALDYSVMKCPDVIVFSSSNMSMLIYSGPVTQVISMDTAMPRSSTPCGHISVFNSDFHQHFEYVKRVTNGNYEVLEYEHSANDPQKKWLKREYEMDFVDGKIHVPNRGYFNIQKTDRDILFTQSK